MKISGVWGSGLRQTSFEEKNIHQPAPRAGWNMKACEMNAAFGLAQLQKLERFKAGSVKIPADEPCGCWRWFDQEK